MTKEQSTILALLRIVFSKKADTLPEGVDWTKVIEVATEQGVLGVCFPALDFLKKESLTSHLSPLTSYPDLDTLMDWVGLVDYMQTQATGLDESCHKVTCNFARAGFDSVILKGQGVSRLYPKGLLRTPGDIDCWVLADRDRICQYLRNNVPSYTGEHEGDLHTEFKWRDTTVEVHFTATILKTPKYNKRLQGWLKSQAAGFKTKTEKTASAEEVSAIALASDACVSEIESELSSPATQASSAAKGLTSSAEVKNIASLKNNFFPIPTLEFNLVYLMLHMYRHYLFEGIGLRHVVDYYIILQRATDEQKKEAMHLLTSFGAGGFCGALMWVLAKSLELKAESMLCAPDPWRGKMLMDAILRGGNFGKADKANSTEYRQWGVKRLWRFVMRNTSLFVAYPHEIGWHIVKRMVGVK